MNAHPTKREAVGRSQVGKNCVASRASLFFCRSTALRHRVLPPQLKRDPLGSNIEIHAMRARPESIIRLSGLVVALLGVRLERACAQDPSWKTYTDSLHGYAFKYPARYRMQEQFHTVFLTDGRVRTQVYVEDWTRAMSQGESHWDLASLAAERAETSCLADGPHCSTSCKARSVEAIPNSYGVRVVVVPRARFDTCKPSPAPTLDPLYVADLSGGGTYYLLIFGADLDEAAVPVDTLRAIVATIRRVAKQTR